jgi:predicted RNA-binding Zn-ribbon protein involved in translation (DUF1610 family)
MVSLEIEKPSTWSIGKKVGILAVILLIVGSFLPHHVNEVKGEGLEFSEDTSNFNYEVWGLWILLPIFSGFFIAILLYIKFDIFLEMGSRRIAMKPFILMIWGLCFFITYLADATRYSKSIEIFGATSSVSPGIGLVLIIIGFLLCAIVGFLEWRYASAAGFGIPKVGLPIRKKEKPQVEVASEPATEVVAQPEPQEGVSVTTVTEEPTKEVTVQPEPTPTAAPSTSEEEKNLLRWARHINEEGQTFEQCMKCNNYVFIKAKDAGASIVFECPDCGEKFTLKK